MRKFVIAAAVWVVAYGVNTPVFAGWGCAYDSSAGIGRMWAVVSEQEARKITMNACTSRKFKGCRIIGCSANVDSKEDADKLWARTPGIKYEPCGNEGQPKC
jgi:hypothetical protein